MLKRLILAASLLTSFAFAGACCKSGAMATDANVSAPTCKLGKDCPCGAECKCGDNCKCKPMQKSKNKMSGCKNGKNMGMMGKGMGAGACSGGGGNCMSTVAFPRFIAAELELTKAQNAKIDEISKKYTAKMSDAPKGCDSKPLNFVKDSKFDKEAFIAKHNEATAAMGKLKAEMFEEVFTILDDKQKKELSDILNFKK